MGKFTFSTVVLCALFAQRAAGASLRVRRGQRPPTSLGRRLCKPGPPSLLEADNYLVPAGPAGSGLGKRGGVVADGFSRVGCEVDIAPESQRISFKEHACGNGLKSCRLTELGMTPRLCFDFCRQYEKAKFFGLVHGRDCYCGVYFHARSVGGEGECNAVCEGDSKEMCGGMEKSSLFEMHMCADSASEAEQAAEMSKEASAESLVAVKAGNTTVEKLLALASAWKLGVCSIAPEGQRACELNGKLTAIANKVSSVASETSHATSVLEAKTKNMAAAQAILKKAGEKATAAEMSGVELSTREVRDAAAKVKGAVAMMKSTMKTINGPAVGSPLKSFKVFSPLGNVKENWYAVCALVPVPGESYAAVAKDDPATCASRCLELSTGTESCAAFNYQYKDGLVTCQMLTADGVVEPDDAINWEVPIFEVSKTKRDDMGIASMGCYAHGAFVAGHPKGPLGTKVVKQVTV